MLLLYARATRVAHFVDDQLAKDPAECLALVDHTAVHVIDGRTISLSVDENNLRTALRAIPLGSPTVFSARRAAGRSISYRSTSCV